MIDLIYWSFVVGLAPIALGLGTRLIAIIAELAGPPETHPLISHRIPRQAPHFAPRRITPMGGFGRGH